MKKCAVMVLSLLMAFLLTACSGTVINWTDTLPPEQKEEPENLFSYISLPAMPAEKPIADPSKSPSVHEYAVSNDSYRLGGNMLSYNEDGEHALKDYTYLYVRIKDYSADYCNIKMKLQNSGAEYVTIQAIYYEMYDAQLPAVTVLSPKFLRDGANTVIARFDTVKTVTETYRQSDVALKEQTLLGFMLLFDSNPAAPMTDRDGAVTIESFELVTNDDPELEVGDSAPIIGTWGSFGFSAIDLQETDNDSGGKDAVATYATDGAFPFLQANIVGYHTDYAAVKMNVKASNMTTLSIAIAYSGGYTMFAGGWGLSGSSFTDGKELMFDFSALKADGSDNLVTGLSPYAIYFYVDSGVETVDGTLKISGIEFIKTSDSDAPIVSASFTSNGAFNITDAEIGGKVHIEYDKSSQWEPINSVIIGYNKEYTILEIDATFYGTTSFGVAINTPTTVIKSNNEAMSLYADDERTQTGTDEFGDYIHYVFVIDLTEHAAVTHVSSLLIYLDAVDKVTQPRTVQFHSITFKKPA